MGNIRCLFILVDINVLGENLQTVSENTGVFIKASKDIGLEVEINIENIVYKRTYRK